MTNPRQVTSIRHDPSGREVPVEVVTVFGRSDAYYRYGEDDRRADRLVLAQERLSACNYVKIDSDPKISRTHGKIDPALPGVSDLNSTNGTYLNGCKLPTRYGEEGPLVVVQDGDRIDLGAQLFRVQVREMTEAERVRHAQAARRGVVACDDDAARCGRAARVDGLLRERKGFELSAARGWPELISACYRLQAGADAEGLIVIALVCAVRGAQLVLGGEELAFEKLIHLIAPIPGRKLVVLDGDGDPQACEQLFRGEAGEDMLLLTATGGPPPAEELAHTMTPGGVEHLRQSVAGEPGLRGALDEAVDGLDALIPADRNSLEVAWIPDYKGRLGVAFGVKLPDEERVISHSLRFGSTTYRF